MRKGDWLQTYTGQAFWPLDPRPEDVDIMDIAHSLSMQCRFNGHCKQFYSVAEHSVIVAKFCSPQNRLWGLLHDASEAYVSDIPRPLKPFINGFKEIEDRVMQVIAERFGLPWPMPAEVKEVDSRLLANEMWLMETPPMDWNVPEGLGSVNFFYFDPERARKVFLADFRRYGGDRKRKLGRLTQPELGKQLPAKARELCPWRYYAKLTDIASETIGGFTAAPPRTEMFKAAL